jgi:anti-sigma factor RsiW
MNCERFQENLFEYLDDTLSPDEKAAVQSHIQICDVCRQAVENERLVAQTLSRWLNEAVETVMLDAHARQSIPNAIRKQIGDAPQSGKIHCFAELYAIPAWLRLTLPVAAVALVLIFIIWHGRGPLRQTASHEKPFSPPASAGIEVPVHVSYSAPRYTFHQEGAMVVDALISDIRVEDGALLAKK